MERKNTPPEYGESPYKHSRKKEKRPKVTLSQQEVRGGACVTRGREVTHRTHDCCLPLEHVVSSGASRAGRWWVTSEVNQFLQNRWNCQFFVLSRIAGMIRIARHRCQYTESLCNQHPDRHATRRGISPAPYVAGGVVIMSCGLRRLKLTLLMRLRAITT